VGKNDMEGDGPAVKELCDAVWNGVVKAPAAALAEEYLAPSAEARLRETEEFLPLALSLAELFEGVTAIFDEKKRERNLLTFADLPALALRLVGEEKDGTYRPTAVGREVASRFKAVFVDEYQDTNRIQDAIFRCITNGRNLFLVGDPKQSVYRFRGAQPEVFAAYRLGLPAYEPAGEAPMYQLPLSDNFRCDESVIDLVNGVFRVLMDETAGDSLYKEADRLRFGKKKEDDRGYPAEFVLLEKAKKEGEEDPEEWSGGDENERKKQEAIWQGRSENREAAWIAERIRGILTGEGQDGEAMRRADGSLYQPSDIAVVARSWEQVRKVREALVARGIESAWEKADRADTTAEEHFVTSLLQAADNPVRDVPLLAILYSPVFRFTPDDLLRLRRGAPDADFYTALREAAESGASLAGKSRAALDALEEVRRAARSVSMPELIFFLYRRFAVEEAYRAPDAAPGAVRKKMLLTASDAQDAGFDTLSRFCGYLAEKKDPEEGRAAGAGVHLMTIHKAKGLEFPVVFVSFLGQYFKLDGEGPVRLTEDTGVTFTLPRVNGLVRYEHLLDKAAREREEAAAVEEEKRVLYVAMTRAREKLILTGEIRSRNKLQERTLLGCESRLSPELTRLMASSARSALEMLVLSLREHPALREGLEKGSCLEDGLLVRRVLLRDGAEEAVRAPAPLRPAAEKAAFDWEKVRSYLDFVYAGSALETLPKKLSVSEILRQGRDEEESLVPRQLSDFQRGVLKADAAFRGTAMHQAMQFADLARAARDPEGEIARLREEGFITGQMAEAVDKDHFRAFFCSDLYRRIAASPRVVHEKRFNVLMDGEKLVGRPGEILIQGVVDLWFEKEDGTLAILDFKTDRLPPDGDGILAARHGEQLRIYRLAVEAMEEKKVTELLLYSFSLDRAVPVPLTSPAV
ncbi:MAG: UvrD-helicase domain-containing protein, partial [Clostridia bacterium]|nr:UvrD-helicase domain-containing protein [Clostridia bacterium]